MQSTYRVPFARALWVALLATLVLLALPGAGIAAGESVGSAPILQAGDEPLAIGSGYGRPDDARRVRSLQRTLRRLGWSPGPVDGLFGPRTEAAVVRFQRAAGLAADGITGTRTTRALRAAEPRPLAVGTGYARPDGSLRVRSLQTRLRRLGLRPGPADGRFGPRTQAAVLRLQAAAGAPLTGMVGARTRRLVANAGRILQNKRSSAPADRRSAPSPTSRKTNKSNPTPQQTSERQTATRPEPDDSGSSGLNILLLVAAAALTAVAGALLGRLGPPSPDTSVPLAHGIVAEGRARDDSIGHFRGRVHALVLGTRGLLRRPEARYLVNDPRKPGPFWVTHREVEKLEGQLPAVARRPGSGHGNGNGSENGGGSPANGVTAVGYATAPKAEPGSGALVREQATAIEALCERNGWRLLELVRDVEEPRVRGLDRPGLTYALERVTSGQASCLVVSQLRRLSPSAADLGRILESIARNGGRLVALDVDVDTAVPAGRKAANVLISVGAWERERVGQRTRKGLEAARAKGQRIGRPGVDDVPELKERIAAMRANGMTLQAIADRLNAEGIPTLRGGERWRPSSVQAAVGYRRPPRRWDPNGGASERQKGGRA